MPTRADVVLNSGVITANYIGGGGNNVIETGAGVRYQVYVNQASDVVFRKSTDGGLTWSNPSTVFGGTVTALAVFYDRWAGIAAGLIHCAYQESVTDDTLYRTINTESADALSTQTVILAGGTTLAGGCLSIARSQGGNVYCATMIDAGTEGGFMRLLNANVPNGAWDAARTTVFEAATQDEVLLVPGFAADNQDMIALFWDASNDEISRKLYDDSLNSWGEASIATGMVDQAAATAFRHFDAVVDLTNSRIILIAWSAVDGALADLRCWTITESAITEVTPVVSNGTDDQGLCALALNIDNGDWIAFYGGKSDGSETYGTNINIYYKVSTDDGATWGAETLLTVAPANHSIKTILCPPRFSSAFGWLPPVCWINASVGSVLLCNAPLPPQAMPVLQIGVV